MWAILCAILSLPPAVTDLRATEHPQMTITGIAWHCTVPTFNDSACVADSAGEVACVNPPRRATATDSVWYHWLVVGLPPPYLYIMEDSTRVARGQVISKTYGTWPATQWHIGQLTQHWISRDAALPELHRMESRRYSRFMRIGEY